MHARQDQPEWVPLPDGPAVLVRGIHSNTAVERHKQIPRTARRAMVEGREWTDRSWQHYIAFLADAVLCGWDGIAEDGQPLAFSRETARRLLSENPDFLATVQEAASGEAA